MEIKNLSVNVLELNRGQIYGLPKNPRFIRDERFKALKKSISDAPEMLALRELIVYPHEDKFVVIGGNMRLRACKELGYSELPCKILPVETPVAKLREYIIKDNLAFGQTDWTALQTDWKADELGSWGMENVNWGVDTGTDLDIPTDGGVDAPPYEDAMAHLSGTDTVYHENEEGTTVDFNPRYESQRVDVNDLPDKIVIEFSFTRKEWNAINSLLSTVDATSREEALLKCLKVDAEV